MGAPCVGWPGGSGVLLAPHRRCHLPVSRFYSPPLEGSMADERRPTQVDMR
jgi:hypothetical protein